MNRKTVISILFGALTLSLLLHYWALRSVEVPVWNLNVPDPDLCAMDRPISIEVTDPSVRGLSVKVALTGLAGHTRIDLQLSLDPAKPGRFITPKDARLVAPRTLIATLLSGRQPEPDRPQKLRVQYRGRTEIVQLKSCREVSLELAMNDPNKVNKRKKRKRKRRVRLQRRKKKPKPKTKPPKKLAAKKKKKPAPKPPEPKMKKKVVQLNEKKETKPTELAKYLANINMRTLKQTRARKTNMHRDAMKPKPNPHKHKKRRTVMLRSRGNPKKAIKKKRHRKRQKRVRRKKRQRPKKLALKKPTHNHQPDSKNPEEFVPKKEKGDPKPRRLTMFDRARLMQPTLLQQFETFGVKKMQQLQDRYKLSQLSKGKRMWKKVRNSLENFIPEVTVGKETYLNTRKSEMAVFIATIHRQIHQMWGFGYLRRWMLLGSDDPINQPRLHLKLEIVLDKNGKLLRVAPFGTSGHSTYDVSAIMVAYSVKPYPKPPAEAVSPNGKVYIHWNFWRDRRQCGTFGAEIKKLAKKYVK